MSAPERLCAPNPNLPMRVGPDAARRLAMEPRDSGRERYVAPRVELPSRERASGPSGQAPHPEANCPSDFRLELDAPWAEYRLRLADLARKAIGVRCGGE